MFAAVPAFRSCLRLPMPATSSSLVRIGLAAMQDRGSPFRAGFLVKKPGGHPWMIEGASGTCPTAPRRALVASPASRAGLPRRSPRRPQPKISPSQNARPPHFTHPPLRPRPPTQPPPKALPTSPSPVPSLHSPTFELRSANLKLGSACPKLHQR